MDNTDEFLEHFGVKGQRWGVRKTTSSSGQEGSFRTRHKTAIRIGLGVAGGAAIAAGAIYTAKHMGSVGSTPVKAIRTPSGPSQQSRDLINSIMARHDEQVRLFDSNLRQRANAVGKHYVSDHVPWVPI